MPSKAAVRSVKMPTGPATWAARPGVFEIRARSQATSPRSLSTSEPWNRRTTSAASPSSEKTGPMAGPASFGPRWTTASCASAAIFALSASVSPPSRP